MPITDLTGTKWIINNAIPNTAGNRYSITFTTNGQTAYYLDNINRLVYGMRNNNYESKYVYFHLSGTRVDCSVRGAKVTTATFYYKKRGDTAFTSVASANNETVESYIYLDAQTEYIFVNYRYDAYGRVQSYDNLVSNSSKTIAVAPANFQDSNISDLTGINTLSYSYLCGASTDAGVFVPSSGYSWIGTSYGYSTYVRFQTIGDGWVNEAYRTIEISGGTDATNPALISWLEANATNVTPAPTPSNKISIGFLPLSKIYYGQSEVLKIIFNNVTLYEAQDIPSITFTVDNVEYTAEENMTWQQFIDSEYNVDDFSVAGDEYVTTSHHHGAGIVGYVICGGVMISDEITANYNYVTYSLGQCP